MIKAIFFDIGEVLAAEGFTTSIKEYEKKHPLPPGRLFKAAHDRPYWREFTLGNITEEAYLENIAKDLGGNFEKAEFNTLVTDNFVPNQELIQYITTLKPKYILGIISNSPKEWFDTYASKFGWDALFDVKAISGYIHIRKPDVGIFKYALEQANVRADEAIYVDNRPERVDGARALGMRVVVYKNNQQLRKELDELLDSGNSS